MIRLKNIEFLTNHKQFATGQVISFSNDWPSMPKHGPRMSMLVGRNGSGKTTILGLIAQLFHHIERYNHQIEAEYILSYSISYGEQVKDVSIEHRANRIYVSVDGNFNRQQLLPNKSGNRPDFNVINRDEPYMLISEFVSFCPKSVVTSAFSIHGEYPNKRAINFLGYKILRNYNINYIYGKNHYQLESISRGILRFIRLCQNQESGLMDVLNLFDLKFDDKVLVHNMGLEPFEDGWMQVNSNWLEKYDSAVQNEAVYLNNLAFIKGDRNIDLDTMSAGEKMLLLRMITILDGIEDDSIVIIEEPELHLDHIWNRQLISLLRALFSNYGAHLLIATHDSSLINSVQNENIVLLSPARDSKVYDRTFLSEEDELLKVLYGEEIKLNVIEQEIFNRITQVQISSEELLNLYNSLGESIYKYLVYRRLKEMGYVERK